MSNWKILGRLVMAPVWGGLFVVFLPIIGFVELGKFVVLKGIEVVASWRRPRISV